MVAVVDGAGFSRVPVTVACRTLPCVICVVTGLVVAGVAALPVGVALWFCSAALALLCT